MNDFRNLKVWERAHKLTLSIYLLTQEFPKDELFGLTSQMRRSAFSIPSNIAEGCGRGSQAEPSRFLFLAMGSSSGLEYQIILSHDLHYIGDKEFIESSTELGEVRRMLNALIQKVNRDKDIVKANS